MELGEEVRHRFAFKVEQTKCANNILDTGCAGGKKKKKN